MANEYAVNSADLTAVADAIRSKGETTEQLVWPDGYILAIEDMETGAATASVSIKVTTSNDSSITPTITITNTYDGTVFTEFEYESETAVKIPAGMPYMITAGQVNGYGTPNSIEGLAIAGDHTEVEFRYLFGRRYGFRRTKAESEPSARIEYLYDAVGMTPMTIDFTTGTPNYGDWKPFIDEICRPVMLKSDGTVDYELDHDNQTLKIDGTASDVANTSYGGNAMVEFRKYKWVHRHEDDNYEYVIFSDMDAWEETYHAYAHTNANNVIQDAFYWSMFKGTNVSSKLRSIGTGTVMGSKSRTAEISYAQANGTGTDQLTNGWYTIYKSGWDYIADLLTLLGKSDDSQGVFGTGRSDASSKVAAGTLKDKGAFWGKNDGNSDVKVMYIEGAWGNSWDGMAGMILNKSNGFKIKMVPPYNTTGDGYFETGIVPTGSDGGYIDTHSCNDETGYVPKSAKGSQTTYMCDGMQFDTSGVRYPAIGGKHNSEGMCGSRCLSISREVSYTYESVGSRISYVPV